MAKTPWLLGAVVGLVLGYLVGYNNLYARQQGQVRLTQRLIAQEQADQEAQQQVTALLDQIERYRAQLPPEPNPSWLVDQAVTAGRAAGIEFSSISPQPAQAGKFFTRLSAGFKFSATYHQLGEFLDQLERSGSYVRVESLDVNRTRTLQAGAPIVDITLSTLHVPAAGDLLAIAPAAGPKPRGKAAPGDV